MLQNSYFEISKVYDIVLQIYKDCKIRVCDKTQFLCFRLFRFMPHLYSTFLHLCNSENFWAFCAVSGGGGGRLWLWAEFQTTIKVMYYILALIFYFEPKTGLFQALRRSNCLIPGRFLA